MSIMGKQVTLGQLLGILGSFLITFGGWTVSQAMEQSELKKDIENNKLAITELKEDKKETNKKLDTIILMLTDVKVQMAGKADKK